MRWLVTFSRVLMGLSSIAVGALFFSIVTRQGMVSTIGKSPDYFSGIVFLAIGAFLFYEGIQILRRTMPVKKPKE